MGIINNVLKIIAPSVAVKRMQNQKVFEILDRGERKYDGAGRGRRFSDTNMISGSQNMQNTMALPLLRERSRDAHRNNPYAKNATRNISNNVIGTGIVANPILNGKTKAAIKTLDTVKKVWKNWAEKTECDFDGLQNLYGLQLLAMKTVAKTGECFVKRVWKTKGKGVPMELHILDPDFLDHNKNTLMPDEKGEYIVNGIQFNKYGKRIAFWLFERHPKEFITVSYPVPANDIAQIFEVEDPGQANGIPSNSSIILRMQDFDEYEDAQLVKQKIAACFAAFITTPAEGLNPNGSTDDSIDHIEPGTIQRAAPGETYTFSNPPQVDGFRDFSRQSLQGQAAGLGMSYAAFTGDLSSVNFSSGRMGHLEYQRNIEILQWNMMIPMFLDKVWDWFTQAAFISGLIPSQDIGVSWTAPRREMIDPLKEVQAIIKQVRAGLLSWQDAVRQMGFSPEEMLEEMKKDKAGFDAAGIMPECDPRYDGDKMGKIVQENNTDKE